MKLERIQEQLTRLSDPARASFLKGFFKTGPGEYGEGDLFRGIRVPSLRKLAKEHQDVPLADVKKLMGSAHHEDRLLALLILVRVYSRVDSIIKSKVYDLYVRSTQRINGWDLVDASAEHIAGAFLWDKDREPLRRLAKSNCLWDRRIAITATFHFIKRGEFSETLKISRMLLLDREDLIHKAVGWMLREVGNRDLAIEEGFLKTHYKQMPRVMLRYAIEKFPEAKRRRYLRGEM
jgi:3-methyladenine DNA glycosylase AlkD